MQLLQQEKLPYFLTLLIALLLYQLNTLLDNYTKVPLLTYHFETKGDIQELAGDVQKETLWCHLYNHSYHKTIDQLTLRLKFKSNGKDTEKVYQPGIIAVAPSALSPNSAYSTDSEGTMNSYTIATIQPRLKYILKATTEKHQSIKSHPSIYIESEQPIRLAHAYSWEGLILYYQIKLQFLLIALVIGTIVIYLYKIRIKND